jgi:hypothetical protein
MAQKFLQVTAAALLSLIVQIPVYAADNAQIANDKLLIEQDKQQLATDRNKLKDASEELQRTRKKFLEDENKLNADSGNKPAAGFWHRKQAPAKAVPAPEQKAAAAPQPPAQEAPSSPEPTELQEPTPPQPAAQPSQ